MPDVRITAYGDTGLLLDLGPSLPAADAADAVDAVGLAEVEMQVAGWTAALRAAALTGVLDVVPAARSVLLHLADDAVQQDVVEQVAALQPLLDDNHEPSDAAPVEIAVVYDGPDLAEVAELTGLTVDEVVRAHGRQPWRVAFAGFAPGFVYLAGGDPRLVVPRRASPRTRVPAGAVALAAGYAAVYPRASPGGWQLIGHTTARLWDLGLDPPALLRPGLRVRFVSAEKRSTDD